MHVCTICAAERSRSQHHMMKHNGRMNLPMSTGCITIDRTLNLGSEETSTTQIREPKLLEQQARTIP